MTPTAALDAVLRFACFVLGIGFLLAVIWFSQPAIAYMGLASAVALILSAVVPWKFLKRLRYLLLGLGVVWIADIVVRVGPQVLAADSRGQQVTIIAIALVLYVRVVWLSFLPTRSSDSVT